MKRASALVLLAVCIWAGVAHPVAAAPSAVRTVSLSGKSYVPLADWARANGFGIHWLGHDGPLQLTNHYARLLFGVDSRDLRLSEINGVKVFLAYPIVLANGAAWLSVVDVNTTIKPLLQPPRNARGSRIRTIVLDPGHGGADPGNVDGSHKEKTYTLLLGQELCDQLKRAGFNASLTRTTDTSLDLPDRPFIARRRGADLFLCLHWNSFGTGKNDVSGVETYCLTPAGAPSSNAGGEVISAGTKPGNSYNDKNMFLAYTLQRVLRKDLQTDDRGVHRARFSVLRTAVMPAVLIEGGFMSNAAESRRIYDPAYRRQMVRAIVEAVQIYKTQVEQAR